MADRVNVTRTYLPPIEEYEVYLRKMWDSNYITNQGPLLNELETTLKGYLGVNNFHFVTNGTLALQIAIASLNLKPGSEIITTPFSYVATVSAILWEKYTPVFVDIDPDTYCIDPNLIENAITDKTGAILGVHVFGNACDVESIEKIATKHDLKVIYDGAHAFGARHNGNSLLSYGDLSICSFHATKIFHTIEGGCIITRDKQLSEKIDLMKRFGHNGDDHFMLGTNAKASEFQAAMGLAVFPHLDEIIEKRRGIHEEYDRLLGESSHLSIPKIDDRQGYNYPYYPILVEDEAYLIRIIEQLTRANIVPRRYFYPSLNKLPYVEYAASCPISEDLSRRILALPQYPDLSLSVVKKIADIVLNAHVA